MVSCVYVCCMVVVCFFFFKQKTAYEMRISDWSSDVLFRSGGLGRPSAIACARAGATVVLLGRKVPKLNRVYDAIAKSDEGLPEPVNYPFDLEGASPDDHAGLARRIAEGFRSEEHTSELKSLMRSSYAGFSLEKKKERN